MPEKLNLKIRKRDGYCDTLREFHLDDLARLALSVARIQPGMTPLSQKSGFAGLRLPAPLPW